MQESKAYGGKHVLRAIGNGISVLLVLLLLFAAVYEVTLSPARRFMQIADNTLFCTCSAAAYLTAKYDANKIVDTLALDTDDTAIRVVTAVSNLNTLSTREALLTCVKYRNLFRLLVDDASLSVARRSVTPFPGGEAETCTLYTLSPSKAQMTAFITTLAKNMETDGGLFVLSRAFYTALMMVAQDATEVMAINAFENAWKSLSGADSAHIEETAARICENNFPITLAARGNRVYALEANLVFEDSPVQIVYHSSGGVFSERRDALSLLVENTEMGLDNVLSFAWNGGLSGELSTESNGKTATHAYGRAQPAAGE